MCVCALVTIYIFTYDCYDYQKERKEYLHKIKQQNFKKKINKQQQNIIKINKTNNKQKNKIDANSSFLNSNFKKGITLQKQSPKNL